METLSTGTSLGLSHLLAVYQAYNPLPPVLLILEKLLPARLPPLPSTIIPRVVGYTVVLLKVVIRREFGTDRDRLTFLHLLPSRVSSHALAVVCSTRTSNGPPDRGLSMFEIVISVMLGGHATITELDRVLSLFPASIFGYIEEDICKPARHIRYVTLGAVGVILAVVLAWFIFAVGRMGRRLFSTLASCKLQVAKKTRTIAFSNITVTKEYVQNPDDVEGRIDEIHHSSFHTSSSSSSSSSSSDSLSLVSSFDSSILSAQTTVNINAPSDTLLASVLHLLFNYKPERAAVDVSAEEAAITIPFLSFTPLKQEHISVLSVIRVRVTTSTCLLVAPSTVYLDNILFAFPRVPSPLQRRALRIMVVMNDVNAAVAPPFFGIEGTFPNVAENTKNTISLIKTLAIPTTDNILTLSNNFFHVSESRSILSSEIGRVQSRIPDLRKTGPNDKSLVHIAPILDSASPNEDLKLKLRQPYLPSFLILAETTSRRHTLSQDHLLLEVLDREDIATQFPSRFLEAPASAPIPLSNYPRLAQSSPSTLSPPISHTVPDRGSKPARGAIMNNDTSKPPPSPASIPSKSTPSIFNVQRSGPISLPLSEPPREYRRMLPVGGFAAALAAVHRQRVPQFPPLPHRPRSQNHQNRYHEHKPCLVRPSSESHQMRLNPTVPSRSTSSEHLPNSIRNGPPHGRRDFTQDLSVGTEKWESGLSAQDLGLHTSFSTSMKSERERIQNRNEYLRHTFAGRK
ncbi:hypothetical protein K439DRAFT_1663451 [Ramaria rubella]|nr:hypothetical protein K439DRAFT_1663451 [Ramaria rubella]